jgi:hypothetical protein
VEIGYLISKVLISRSGGKPEGPSLTRILTGISPVLLAGLPRYAAGQDRPSGSSCVGQD